MLIACLIAMAEVAAAQSAPADAIVGKWFTADNEAIVEIYSTQSRDGETRYDGRIVWLAEPLVEEGHEEAGQPKRDIYNPDEGQRDQPIIGLVILNDFKYNTKKDRWDSGTIYDPNNGETYKCVIKRVAPSDAESAERIEVRGYVGIRLIGRTTVWTRVPDGEDPTHSSG
ncbi:MAG: DUF2147 domain-containing protein [Candidatus Hydrogenedentales bacterium]